MMRPGSETFRVRQDLSQDHHIEGLPLGTIGGLRVRHDFPVDGEYDFQTKLYRTNLNIVRGLQYPSEFEVSIDGRPVHHVTIGGTDDLAAMFEKPTDTGDALKRGCACACRSRPGRTTWRQSSSATCRWKTPSACSGSSAAPLTTSTGRDVRTSRRSRYQDRFR
jgi:hypothetical protein